MSIEDIADISTFGGYTAITGSTTSTIGKVTKVGEGIIKTFSGEYERDRAKAASEASAAQRRQSDREAQLARVAQTREARIRRAQVLASTGSVGAESSGVSGATASIGSQVAANIGNINVSQGFANEASAANMRAAEASSNMALGQIYASGISTIFSAAGGPAAVKSMWADKKIKSAATGE